MIGLKSKLKIKYKINCLIRLILPEKAALFDAIKRIDSLDYKNYLNKHNQRPTLEQFIKKLVLYIQLGSENSDKNEKDIMNEV